MTRWYVDTSAAMKLLVAAPESDSLAHELDTGHAELAACYLLETELRRVVNQVEELRHEDATNVLEGIDLYEVPPSLFRESGLLPGTHLRSLDAIHLAAAVRIGVDAVLTYDVRMADAARDLGLTVVAPQAAA